MPKPKPVDKSLRDFKYASTPSRDPFCDRCAVWRPNLTRFPELYGWVLCDQCIEELFVKEIYHVPGVPRDDEEDFDGYTHSS